MPVATGPQLNSTPAAPTIAIATSSNETDFEPFIELSTHRILRGRPFTMKLTLKQRPNGCTDEDVLQAAKTATCRRETDLAIDLTACHCW